MRMSVSYLATDSCEPLGESLQLSVPQYLHWKIDNNNTYFMGFLWELNKKLYDKSLAHNLETIQ